MDTITQPRNLDALYLGTGEFSFSDGAISLADARAKGHRDFGNIQAAQIAPEIEVAEHEGSYRGAKRVDRRAAIKSGLKYVIKPDEMGRQNLLIALGGIESGEFTQSVLNFGIGAAWTFGSVAAVAGRWYDVLTVPGAQARELTSLYISKPVLSATAATATDQITATANGVAINDRVIFTAGTIPAGLTANQVYYVQSVVDADNFKVSATLGGAAIDITTTGATLQVYRLLADSAYTADLKLGRVRFAAAQTTTLTPFLSGSAVASGADAAMKKFIPMQSLVRSGFGRLVIWDDTHSNKLVYQHRDFSCQVSYKSGGEFDGKKFPEYEFEILVTDTVGEAECAED